MSDSLRTAVDQNPPPEDETSPSSGDAQAAVSDGDRLAELQSQLQAARESLALAERSLERSERRNRVEELLRQARVIDLDAGRLLTESLLSTMKKPDEALAVRQLTQSKPKLFNRGPEGGQRSASASGAGALGPRVKAETTGDLEAEARAAAEGDERALARYLKLRRAGG